MILREISFAILRKELPGTSHDRIEVFQFINDNGLTDELTASELLELRKLIESGHVRAPTLSVVI